LPAVSADHLLEDRRASWLELLVDLVLVAAVGALAAQLHQDHSLDGLASFAAPFVPVWWAWWGFTWYSTAFNSDDAVNRIALLAAMGGDAVLAAGVSGVADGRPDTFVIAYAGLFALLAALYSRAWRRVPVTWSLSPRYAIGYLSGASLWLSSLGLEEGARPVVWVVAMVVLMASPVLAAASLDVLSYDPSHIAERYGLFTLIVLGESVVATVAGHRLESGRRLHRPDRAGDRGSRLVAVLRSVARDARGHDALGLRVGPGPPARVRRHRGGRGGHRVSRSRRPSPDTSSSSPIGSRWAAA
jgi:low temperature requirement protein LtrA